MLYEGIVLLGRTLGQWLEPVRIVGHSVLVGPLLHAFCHGICNAAVKDSTIIDNVNEFLIYILLQVLVHLVTGEHILPVVL